MMEKLGKQVEGGNQEGRSLKSSWNLKPSNPSFSKLSVKKAAFYTINER